MPFGGGEVTRTPAPYRFLHTVMANTQVISALGVYTSVLFKGSQMPIFMVRNVYLKVQNMFLRNVFVPINPYFS